MPNAAPQLCPTCAEIANSSAVPSTDGCTMFLCHQLRPKHADVVHDVRVIMLMMTAGRPGAAGRG